MLDLPANPARLEAKDITSTFSHGSIQDDSDSSVDPKSISKTGAAPNPAIDPELPDPKQGGYEPFISLTSLIRNAFSRHALRMRIEGDITLMALWRTAIIFTVCLLPSTLYVIYAYYLTSADIFFNSRLAFRISHTINTNRAFTAFYWILAVITCIVNTIFGSFLVLIGFRIGKWLPLPVFPMVLWMVLWLMIYFLYQSGSLWIRSVVADGYQTGVFTHGCANKGWDLDVSLWSLSVRDLPEYLPVVGNANISWTSRPNENYTAHLVRHADNPLHFDFVPFTFAPGSEQPPFTNVTYDWQNTTYIAFRPNSTNVTGTFEVNPNLTLPSLNVTTLDETIPFQRPGYGSCWPPAATLVTWNSTTQSPSQVLETLTFLPGRLMKMKVCAMAGPEVAERLQISLGVVFINHHYYLLCKTQSSARNVPGRDDTDGFTGSEGQSM